MAARIRPQPSSRRDTGFSGRAAIFALAVLLVVLAAAAPAFGVGVLGNITVGAAPQAVAVNPATGKVYVANHGSDSVTVIDAVTGTTSTVAVGPGPEGSFTIAVNPRTNEIYVANTGGNTVTVIDGATNATDAITVGLHPHAVAVNPVTNRIYVANFDGQSVSVIDGTSKTVIATLPTSSYAMQVAVNPVTNKVYVANLRSANVTVIDGATNTVSATVAVGYTPCDLAVNPITNKVYVANRDTTTISVIDGATNTVTPVTVGSNPLSVAVNPVTNKVYVANGGSDSVTVVDGATLATSTVAVGDQPGSVAVDAASDRIFVADAGSNSVHAIDGATNTVTATSAGSRPYALAVDPVLGRVFVANYDSKNVTVIDEQAEQAAQAVPLTVAIEPLPGDVCSIPTPAFSFTASSFSPTAPPPRQIHYQVDTLQGPWSEATPEGASGTGTVTAVTPGTHVLYAYAVDCGQAGLQGSPIIGSIKAYVFTYAPVSISISAPTAASSWPSGSAQTVTWSLDRSASAGEFRVSLINQTTSTWYVNKQVLAVAGQTAYQAAVTAAVPAGSYKAAVYWRPTVGSGSWTATKKSAAFSVTPINITAPSASTVWPTQATCTVAWNVNPDMTGGEFRVSLIDQASGTWYVNKLLPATAGQTSYAANVNTLVPGGRFRAAVYWRATPGSGAWTATQKSAAFTIATLAVTSPTAASPWRRLTTQSVAWSVTPGLPGGEFRVSLVNQTSGTWYVNTFVPVVPGQVLYTTAFSVAVPAGGYKAAVYWRPSGSATWVLVKKSASFTVTP